MLKKRTLVSPAGALLALVCFFLPWGRFSCAGISRTFSGPEIGGICWTVFAAALAIPLVVGAAALLRKLHFARIAVAACALAALVVLLIEQANYVRGHETGFGRVHGEDVGVQLGLGGAGTVLGLLIALAGSMLLGWRRRPRETQRKTPQP
jgi:hypothetical protein